MKIHKTTDPNDNESKILEKLKRLLVGKDKPVRTAEITSVPNNRLELPYFAANSVHAPWPGSDPKNTYQLRTASGTADTSARALIKAISEAYERYVTGIVRIDIEAKANELTDYWLDPRRTAPLTDTQYQRLKQLQTFTESKLWQWARGTDISSASDVLVPIDLVFCPIQPELIKRKLCYEASTSGVAAYSNEKEAITRGLLELIERDAVMRSWFTRSAPSKIAESHLPKQLRDRCGYWRKHGRETYILDLSGSGVITVMVVIYSENEYPCFSFGSASSITSFDKAISKAFQEADSELLDTLSKPKARKILPEAVTDPEDHAKLYDYPDHLDNIRWLWSSHKTVPAPTVGITYDKLIEKLKPTVIKLSPPGAPLFVVRVLCDKLVPINFGYGTEHYAHPAIKNKLNPESLKLPHFFA